MAIQRLLASDLNEHRPDLENRVAFQWRRGTDTLAYQHATRRDETVLSWLASAVRTGTAPRAVLDVGCAYGNYLFMLNAFLGCDQEVSYEGVDLYTESIAFASEFAENIPGYRNCNFRVHDVETRLPFEDRTFDAVCIADVLEHLPRPVEVLKELRRVTKPSGSIVVSTPLKNSVFKRLAARIDSASGGRLYAAYYAGKHTELDAEGLPIMETHAGHEHISEMSLNELREAAASADLHVADEALMAIMSGSKWFDAHPFLLAGLLGLEAVHRKLQRPSWAHSVVVRLTH